jgi:hypothetical protein
MKPGITLMLMVFILQSIAQVIPANRQVNWSDALFSYNTAVPLTELNVMDFGATGNGTTNDQPAVMNAIAALNGSLGYIYFPPGIYKMTSPIDLPDSVILKGHSSDSSALLFNFAGVSMNCIGMVGSSNSVLIQINNGYTKGNQWIITDSAFLFTARDWAEILENNGSWDEVPADWATQCVGQILQVESVNGDTIFLESPLRISYESTLNPRIRKFTPRLNAGVECLKIQRQDQSTSGANIMISYAAYCMVRGVESDVSVAAHVDIFQSSRILVEGCYFHHAFAYDGGSKRGYGVTLNAHSGECLVTNNIFRFLRHAMMVKTGANGNVFSYNYSREVHRSEPISYYGGDISLHGHYAFANLFEGNIVQNINVDHEWGPSGPYNTLFRNRAELFGIIFSTGNITTSDSQHIVGNEVTNTGLGMGQYIITGVGHIEHGNNIKGTIKPPGTGTLNDTSYYLEQEPPFWEITDAWPSIGIPRTLGSGSNPARSRWIGNGSKTVCPLRKSWSGTVNNDWENPHNWKPYGVPDEAVEVTLPAPASNNPMISSGSTYYVRSLVIEDDKGIGLTNGSTLVIKK